MSEAVKYSCSICKKEISVPKGEAVPICCGREMEPLPFCTTAPHAEMARNYDEDEPCDPGRSRASENNRPLQAASGLSFFGLTSTLS